MSVVRRAFYRSAVRAKGLQVRPIGRALAELRASDRADLPTRQALRDEAFRGMVRHAWDHVPWYRRAMESRGLRPDDLHGTADVVRLPVLDREGIRAAGRDLRADDVPDEICLVRRSGGTTGEPIASYVDPHARALETYSFLRGLEWMGWRPGTSIVWLSGGSLGDPAAVTPRERIKRFVTGSVYLPAFGIGPDTARTYWETIADAGPCVVVGYASALLHLATHRDKATRPTRVERVFSTAETLPLDWQERIEAGFGAEVRNYYGCGEVNSLGYQVERLGPYVIPDEHVIVEAEPDGAGEGGRLLVTTLFNRAQPLIRYAIGDRGEVAPPGVLHPTRGAIARLHGRQSDMFLRVDGTPVSGALGPHLVFVTKLPVKRYQYVQEGARIEFRYEPEAGDLPADERERVRAILREQLGDALDVSFVRTTDFVLTRAGKHRIIVQSRPSAP